MEINKHLYELGKEFHSMSDEEVSNRMNELESVEKDCEMMDIPVPIENQFERLYLETGNKIKEMLK